MVITNKTRAGIAVIVAVLIAVFVTSTIARATQGEDEALIHRMLSQNEMVLNRLLDIAEMAVQKGVVDPAMLPTGEAFGGTSNLDSLSLDSNLTVTGTMDVTATSTIDGRLVANDSVIYSGAVNSTTTNSTAVTLNEDDLTEYRYTYVYAADIATGGNVTLTTPASSTVRDLVPAVGDEQKVCFFANFATTSDSLLILAAGTGFDFRYASSTATNAAVPSLSFKDGEEGCIAFRRQPDQGGGLGDITAELTILSEND